MFKNIKSIGREIWFDIQTYPQWGNLDMAARQQSTSTRVVKVKGAESGSGPVSWRTREQKRSLSRKNQETQECRLLRDNGKTGRINTY